MKKKAIILTAAAAVIATGIGIISMSNGKKISLPKLKKKVS